MRLPDARTPRPLELIEAEIKGLEEDFEAAQGGNGVESRTERTKSDRNYRHLMLSMLVSLPSLLEGESHARTLHPTPRRQRESPLLSESPYRL
jgi:hypothetical protein